MKNEQNARFGAEIERGIITEADDGKYTVSSYDRPGVTAWEMEPIGEETYQTGDGVYFFLFPDGKGRILCGIA